MTMKDGPAGRDEAEMIAESRLDYLLDSVEAPEPSATLRYRLYGLGPAADGTVRVPFWRRLGGLFAGGPVLRPVGGLVALAGALVMGVVLGHALPDGAGPEPAGGQPVVAIAQVPDAAVVIASLADFPDESDAMSVDNISLVAPASFQAASLTTGGPGDDDDVGGMPLY